MEPFSSKPWVGPFPNPVVSVSTFMQKLAGRFDETRRFAAAALLAFQPPKLSLPFASATLPAFQPPRLPLPFASVSERQGKQPVASENLLSSEHVARRLSGTSVYTVSNTDNEFVLISNPDGVKSIGLLCFRREDAEAFLDQVRSRRGTLRNGAKVVPISLDQVLVSCCLLGGFAFEVYTLKVEGIAFRFLPDPVQIKNALELKASDTKCGFDGVPVFQSDLLVVKKKDKRYSPIYFQKEDIEKALSTVTRMSKGLGVSQHIVVGSLEDVIKKIETNEKNSGWEDLIFIPPGKSHSQHIQEFTKGYRDF